MAVNGDVSFDGQLLLEVNGNSVNSYDLLTSTGDINFGANANAIIDFNFAVNSEFTLQVVNAGSLTNFANVNYSALNLTVGYTIDLSQLGNKVELKVRLDTDGDGIANETDTDDDGDGMPDIYELANGLDPLVNDADLDNGKGITNYQAYLNSLGSFYVITLPNGKVVVITL